MTARPKILLPTLLLALVACLTCTASEVWIEAESPAATNFPPPEKNPYRAREFWEQDMLSGGSWIGMKWEDRGAQPFLEYSFDIPETGKYRLYSRKFFTFGNFRWRIDGGEWRGVSAKDHVPLDIARMRDAEDQIALSWFPMGSAVIEAGKHVLRVEPIFREDTPGGQAFNAIGYDAFLFSGDLFFPRGRLRPGENFVAQTPEAFAFQPAPDPFHPSEIDWRALNEPFAGARGGLAKKGEHIVYRDTGEPARIVAANVDPSIIRNEDNAAYLFRALSKKGVNMVRFELATLLSIAGADGGEPAVSADTDALDSLRRAISQAKAEGIYTALTWNVKHSLAASLGPEVQSEFSANPLLSLSHRLVFDPSLTRCVREGWKAVLSGSLPGGGSLGKDPALALVTLGQMESLFAPPAASEVALRVAGTGPMEAAFLKSVSGKYGSEENARRAWSTSTPENGQNKATLADFLLDPAGVSPAFAKDATRFLSAAQDGWFRELASFLRGEGYKGLISASNRAVDTTPELGLANMRSLASGDVVERHGNFLPFYEPSHSVWHISEGSRFRDRSALRFDPLDPDSSSRFLLPTQAFAYEGHPSVLTEISWPMPNRYRGEMPLVTFLQSSLQDVSLVGFNNVETSNWISAFSYSRTPAFTPAIFGQFPALAYAFRKGFFPGPNEVAQIGLSAERVLDLEPAPISEVANTQFSYRPAVSAANTSPGSPLPPPWVLGKLSVRWQEPASGLKVVSPPEIDADKASTPDREVRWDYRSGLLAVDAPKIKAFGGFLSAAEDGVRLGCAKISSAMDFGVIAIVSLDGKPLDSSAKMLVQVFGEEFNNGSFSDGGKLRTIRAVGRPPLMVGNLSGEIMFDRPDAAQLVFRALDENGYPVNTAAVGPKLNLLPATLYYLVEK